MPDAASGDVNMTSGSMTLEREGVLQVSLGRLSTITGALLALWIGVIPFIDLAFRTKIGIGIKVFARSREAPPQVALGLMIVILAGAIPPLVAAMGAGLDFRRARYFAFAIFGLCLAIPLSYLGQTDLSKVAYVVVVYYVFACMLVLISANVDHDALARAFFTTFALINTASMIAVLIDHDVAWGRLMGRTAPNYWGGIALATIISAIGMRGWVLRGAIVLFAAYIMTFTQSRGCMLALIFAAMTVAVVLFFTMRGKAWLWLAGALTAVLLIVLGADFFANDLLKLNDPLRGLGSGVTGRADAWVETWGLFVEHPWLGVGYRQHEQFLLSETSSHNGYLATMAELGIVGAISYVIFMFGGLFAATTKVLRGVTAPRLATFAFIVAYVALGLVERVGLNTGNAYSLAMIIMLALAWRHDTEQPATA